MPVSLPYLPSNKNLDALFAKIQSAKVPEKFNHAFLQETIGLKGSNDRPLIPLLRALGFIDQAGTPTASYRLLKSAETAKSAIGDAVRRAYAAVFAANEKANTLSGDKLKGLIAQVAGTDDDMTARIASTFAAIAKLGTFEGATAGDDKPDKAEEETLDLETEEEDQRRERAGRSLRPEFHYNIQIHLPSNATEEVYLSIFNALRKTFR